MDDRDLWVSPTVFGVVYWKDHVLAAMHDHAKAESAVSELVAAGFPDDGAKAWTGEFVTEKHKKFLANRSAFQRLAAMLPSNESEVMDIFVEDAESGHSIVAVQANNEDEARRVSEVLRRYGGHHLIHYRDRTFVDL